MNGTCPVFAFLGAAIAAITWPIGLAIAAIAGLAIGAYYLIKHWEKVKDFFSNLWDGIKDIFFRGVDFVKGKINSIVSFLPDFVKEKLNIGAEVTAKGAKATGNEENIFRPNNQRATGIDRTIKRINESTKTIKQEAALRVQFDNVPENVSVIQEKKDKSGMFDLDMGYNNI